MKRDHHYTAKVTWTGNLGLGTADYRAYSRNHEISAAGKVASLPCSSDPVFRGDASRYNPEDLFVASLEDCHMLWVLHLCADAGIVVTEYEDDPHGLMVEVADGPGQFLQIDLRPRMRITDPARIEDAKALHARAHQLCFLANSVRLSLSVQPLVEA